MKMGLSIIVPMYNAAETIERTVRSLAVIGPLNRARSHVWVIDDGSTDSSVDACERTLRALNWPAYTVRRKVNGGSGSARNCALLEITQGWVLFLDADDELISDPFPILDASSSATAVLFGVEFRRRGKALATMRPPAPPPSHLGELFSAGNPYPTPALVFRRDSAPTLFDESLRYLEDWHYWATNPGIFACCEDHSDIVIGRVHSGNGNKTSNQHPNGQFRIRVAEQLEALWTSASEITKNNLSLQKAIGAIQMGSRREWGALARLPVSSSLYAKALVYFLAYRAYLRVYPYA